MTAVPIDTGTYSVETFAVDVVRAPDHAVLHLRGDLDVASVACLDAADSQVRAEGVADVVLDLSALDFVDSSGLQRFLAVRKRHHELGGHVVLHAPTERILRILDIVGLTQVFSIT